MPLLQIQHLFFRTMPNSGLEHSNTEFYRVFSCTLKVLQNGDTSLYPFSIEKFGLAIPSFVCKNSPDRVIPAVMPRMQLLTHSGPNPSPAPPRRYTIHTDSSSAELTHPGLAHNLKHFQKYTGRVTCACSVCAHPYNCSPPNHARFMPVLGQVTPS